MIEADFEQIGDRRVGGDVAAELGMLAVGAHHHRERVPAHDRDDALLDLEVAGILRLLGERDRVAVGRVEHRRQRHAARARAVEELAQEERRALAAFRSRRGRRKRRAIRRVSPGSASCCEDAPEAEEERSERSVMVSLVSA